MSNKDAATIAALIEAIDHFLNVDILQDDCVYCEYDATGAVTPIEGHEAHCPIRVLAGKFVKAVPH